MALFEKQMPEIFASEFYGLFATEEIVRFLWDQIAPRFACTRQGEENL